MKDNKNITIIIFVVLLLLGSLFVNGKDRVGIIAHRGFWTALDDSTQNSVAALQAAIDAGFYGSETDVWITKDNYLVIYHDRAIDGIVIENCDFDEISEKRLSNGELLPSMDDFLEVVKNSNNSTTKLIIEIKNHRNKERSIAAAAKTIDAVLSYDLQNKVEYISFEYDALLKVKEILPAASCYYLSGDKSPTQLFEDGINMDYSYEILDKNVSWISDAHNYGLKTNVWTVDTDEQIQNYISKGIDFVTTNYPDRATEIYRNLYETSLAESDLLMDKEDNYNYRYYDLLGFEIRSFVTGRVVLRVNRNGDRELIINY